MSEEVTEVKPCNPAAVGLGGFALTTFILQCHNLGWVEIGPVLWLGLVYGGLAQLIAGYHEFKLGNNFGFSAFVSYGAFWIAICLYLIVGHNPDWVAANPTFQFTAGGLGWFLAAWTIYTAIMFIASMKHNGALAFTFLTLTLGFIGLVIKEFTGSAGIGTLAAWDLLVCAFSAWYIMAGVIFGEVGINLPMGKPWL